MLICELHVNQYMTIIFSLGWIVFLKKTTHVFFQIKSQAYRRWFTRARWDLKQISLYANYLNPPNVERTMWKNIRLRSSRWCDFFRDDHYRSTAEYQLSLSNHCFFSPIISPALLILVQLNKRRNCQSKQNDSIKCFGQNTNEIDVHRTPHFNMGYTPLQRSTTLFWALGGPCIRAVAHDFK